ncbi:LysR family transcriptional regulator [Burkholderia multivorans]|uniref:LysR family transcriptional regulator n=1 Tax=Burkholderia multivorans TaxID=87883 RepID=UPI000CFF12FA|nr:LysR family transcriptional regulator [Burkholderia multivorans]MBR8242618.1 LysR family transcriptional regulator [Burkholderia multivorans]MDN7946664.1 LysR family transcriptional regulator [Burkholderia multivorans]MDR9175679.1 HTH-type transcriptional regulator GltC [Burkholderia multivorans]MDR9179740.1 HTH-type transcriptional regulator GltC [Burkholderia multivorans]MDR9188459.1 HTH-type transcriptional regulator GltC [Burkholderia multivorans]
MRNRINEEITFRKLEVLLAFMEAGSLAKAAEALGVSTVSVHRALHTLEEGMHCTLFRHEGRNLLPTEAAQVLAEVADEVLKTMTDGIRATREAAGYGAGQLKIGSLYSLTIRTVPEVVIALKERRPQLQAELVLGSNADLLDKLRQGAIDATLMALPEPDAEIESIALFEDEMFFAAPVDSPYARCDAIDLGACRDEPFVSLGDGFATHRGFTEAFRAASITPNIAMRVGDIFSLINLVSGGVGYSLLPGRVRDLFAHKITLVPIAGHTIRQTIGLSFLHRRERDPNLLALATVCRLTVKASNRG